MTRDNVLTRVLILTPTKKDGEVTSSLLTKADVTCFVCRDLRHLAQEHQRRRRSRPPDRRGDWRRGASRFVEFLASAAGMVGPARRHVDAG